jgi:hypothetical protein
VFCALEPARPRRETTAEVPWFLALETPTVAAVQQREGEATKRARDPVGAARGRRFRRRTRRVERQVDAGLEGEFAMTLNAGKPVPAHFIAMPTAAANSPGFTGGFCTAENLFSCRRLRPRRTYRAGEASSTAATRSCTRPSIAESSDVEPWRDVPGAGRSRHGMRRVPVAGHSESSYTRRDADRRAHRA